MKTSIRPGLSFLLTCIASFLILPVCPLYGQEYSYTHYDVKDGLPASNVHQIFQDKTGFIWFATESGLCRFDGTRFRTFTADDGLPSSEVFSMYEDGKGRLWINSFKAATCYYYKGVIHNQYNDTVLRKVKLDGVGFCEMENKRGDILVQGVRRSYIITSENQVKELQYGFYVNERQWGKFFDGIASMGPANINFTQLAEPLVNGDTFHFCVLYKCRAAGGPIKILEADFRHYIIPPGTGSGYFLDNAKPCTLLMYLTDSLLGISELIDKKGVVLYNIYTRKYGMCYLPGICVHFIMQDREGNYWFSTKAHGVYKLGKTAIKTCVIGTTDDPQPVFDILKVDGHLYLGSEDGRLWQLAVEPAGTTNGFLRPQKVQAGTSFIKRIQPGTVHLWSSDFLHVTGKGSKKELYISEDGELHLISHDGIELISPAGKRIETLYSGRSSSCIKNGGKYYIGTVTGVYVVDEHDRKKNALINTEPLLKTPISDLAKSEDGTLWIGTFERGVIGYKDGKVVADIAASQGGLNSNICRCLYVSGKTLWVGTDKGAARIDISGGKPIVTDRFTMADGLSSDIINAVYQDGDMVYIATNAGMNYFSMKDVPKHSLCSIYLTDIYVSGKWYYPGNGPLLLSHKDNNIRFEYSGISFLSGGNITYRYRLLGLNDQWQTTRENILSYPSLPSGKYTLQLIAINKFDDESRMLQWSFEVEPLLWQRWWFRLLLVLVFLAIVWLVVRRRIRSVERREGEKHLMNKRMVELEQMALRAQMNPHFIFNCLNSIQHYIMRQDVRGANHYLSRFAALVRQTLDHSSKMYVPLEDEAAFLNTYLELERLQMDGSFTYTIDIEEGIDRSIQVPNMVIQPYVENAVKHGMGDRGGGDRITLVFTEDKENSQLICTIEDNGIGISRSKVMKTKQHQSKGMSITQDRVDMLNQYTDKKIQVMVQDISLYGTGHGTRVIIEFPIQKL